MGRKDAAVNQQLVQRHLQSWSYTKQQRSQRLIFKTDANQVREIYILEKKKEKCPRMFSYIQRVNTEAVPLALAQWVSHIHSLLIFGTNNN